MSKEQFQTIISQTIKQFPDYFLEKLKNVAIVVDDEPSDFQKNQVGYQGKGCLLGLYEGIPQVKRGVYNKAIPDKISLFQKNIENFAGGDEKIIKQVVFDTLWHEIAHHFGFEEEEIQKMKRNKSQN